MKKVSVEFSLEAKKVLDFLAEKSFSSKQERMLFDAVRNKIDLIKSNYRYGSPVPKRLIPSFYREAYDAENLFHVKLPQFWRMLYTAKAGSNEIEIIAFVLDILDHPAYDKRFGYRKK